MEAASFTAGAGEIGEIDEAADEELLAEGVGSALSAIGGGEVTVWGAAGGAALGLSRSATFDGQHMYQWRQ